MRDKINPNKVLTYMSKTFNTQFSRVTQVNEHGFLCATPANDRITVIFVDQGETFRPEFIFHSVVTIQERIPFVVHIREVQE